MKFLSKLFDKLALIFSYPVTVDYENYSDEPEFLGEYWVYVGTKSCSTIYAKSASEAKEKVLRSTPSSDRGSVYAVFKRTSNLKNPDYQAY